MRTFIIALASSLITFLAPPHADGQNPTLGVWTFEERRDEVEDFDTSVAGIMVDGGPLPGSKTIRLVCVEPEENRFDFRILVGVGSPIGDDQALVRWRFDDEPPTAGVTYPVVDSENGVVELVIDTESFGALAGLNFFHDLQVRDTVLVEVMDADGEPLRAEFPLAGAATQIHKLACVADPMKLDDQ